MATVRDISDGSSPQRTKIALKYPKICNPLAKGGVLTPWIPPYTPIYEPNKCSRFLTGVPRL